MNLKNRACRFEPYPRHQSYAGVVESVDTAARPLASNLGSSSETQHCGGCHLESLLYLRRSQVGILPRAPLMPE